MVAKSATSFSKACKDDRRELDDAGHDRWESGKDREDRAVVGQYRERIGLNASVKRLDYFMSDGVLCRR
jgi:hypothetical protein